MNKLEQLKKITTVVADTGDIDAIERFQPIDATTNPSLILKAAQLPRFTTLVNHAVKNHHDINSCIDELTVSIGKDILSVITGRISTEVDPELSFNTGKTVTKAQQLIAAYEKNGIGKDRVLIKIAATWEGINAAKILEQQGIHCNLTLLFSFAQAVACADAGVTLISPFVGRILDWYKAANPSITYSADNDPGVLSVKRIFNYYKHHAYPTTVMGASFRSCEQVEALAGCDYLTINPTLLEGLSADHNLLKQQLFANNPIEKEAKQTLNESDFRWQLNEDAMACDKLAEGVRQFAKDKQQLALLLSALKK